MQRTIRNGTDMKLIRFVAINISRESAFTCANLAWSVDRNVYNSIMSALILQLDIQIRTWTMINFLCITMLFKTVIKVISPLLSGVQLQHDSEYM